MYPWPGFWSLGYPCAKAVTPGPGLLALGTPEHDVSFFFLCSTLLDQISSGSPHRCNSVPCNLQTFNQRQMPQSAPNTKQVFCPSLHETRESPLRSTATLACHRVGRAEHRRVDRRAGAGSFCGARTLAILALAALAYWQETGQGCSLASTPAGAACSGSALSAARIDRSSSGCPGDCV